MNEVGVLCTSCKGLPVRLRIGPPLVDFAWEGSCESTEMGKAEEEAASGVGGSGKPPSEGGNADTNSVAGSTATEVIGNISETGDTSSATGKKSKTKTTSTAAATSTFHCPNCNSTNI